MTRWLAYPRRRRLLQLGRLARNGGGLIVLAIAVLPFLPPAEAVLVVAASLAWTALAMRFALDLRDARALHHLRQALEAARRDGIPLVPLAFGNYVPGGLTRPVAPEGREIAPTYRIVPLPGRSPTAIQYAPTDSVIVVPWRPAEMSPGKLIWLLHEMGHIGTRNYLVATSGRSRHEHYLAPGTWRHALAAARPQFFASSVMSIATVAPVAMFAEGSFLAYAGLWALLLFSGAFAKSGLRFEAELEADHFAIHQMTSYVRLRPDALAGARNPLLNRRLARNVPRDTDLDDEEHAERTGAFAAMQFAAIQTMETGSLVLMPSDYYAWWWHGLAEAIWTAISLAAIVAIALILPLQPTFNAGVLFAPLIPLAAFLVAHVLRRRALAAVDRLLPLAPVHGPDHRRAWRWGTTPVPPEPGAAAA